ncbi:MAG: DUF1801 domain-containing protein [Brevibacterium sp.]|uniref:iron chaperone n=1 Tax=Brevibacterium sp. TaxID=1701 RepID=UPI00264789EE|nr:DUF1801 domain-containing protein [Brevibacterium sp.]MDN5808009.1 DUF1801 domain-containing protein [Brevibacterium sp.]MDN5834433.1 DUF1801 domain-containing protein [Brevibacterium sp.]MDN5876853.1 DUF1801 domain-containing protein [Brevibacterium sp.]MDN5910719.1 DUF1801 domain-containing protein [Brevibacterium sp.]MDN6123236.1 DUF1801 domain-containing protein [Brevibacterium sp.]
MTKRVHTSRPGNVDEYIAGVNDAHKRDFLHRLRDLSRAAAPAAEEGLKWGNPAYFVGTILFAFAGYAKHANVVFTPSTKEAFADRLSGFDTGKGSIKLYYDREIPTELLADMIAHRIREYEVDGVKWM